MPRLPSVLTPQDHPSLTTSPFGPALRRQSLVAIRVDGVPLETLNCKVDGDTGQRVIFAHPGGLDISIGMEPDPVHDALVWHMDLRQDLTGPGARVHDLCPLTLTLDGLLASDPIIHSWLGGASQSFFPPDAYTPGQRVLYPRTPAFYGSGHFAIGTRGGRSSDQHMPYLLIENAGGLGGLWCALGWSGHWTAEAIKPKDSVDLCLTMRVEPCDLRLPPGAGFTGPSVALGLYSGDLAAGCNALRRWLRSRMPALPGDGDLAHFNTWTSLDANVDEQRLLDAVDRVAGQGLRYFMLDAGWYPCPPGDFNRGVGNWQVDAEKFPRGLEVVAERVRANDMAMGLWIEPERAHRTSELARRHPDWLLTVPGSDFALVNFALPAVRKHFQALIADFVGRLDLRWLKWDFNMDPLPHWREVGDGGLAHLGHVSGIWETFDWLRRAFPELLIENCASGGNRIDWTMFSRSHLNFANDQYTHPDCIRRILGRMAAFMPSERLNMIFGPFQGREYGDQDWQILLGSAFGVSEPVDNWTVGFRRHLHRHLALHHTVSGARSGDFYRLTPDTPILAAWEAWQLHDPDTNSGILAAWRSGAPEPAIMLRPRAIDATRPYIVSNMHDGEEHLVTGEILAQGIEATATPESGALHVYRPYLPTG